MRRRAAERQGRPLGAGRAVQGGGPHAIGQYSVETFAEFVGADIKFTTGILQEDCQALRNRYFARK